jgi:hypothetical protein
MEQLAPASRELVDEVDAHTLPSDSSRKALEAEVNRRISYIVAREQEEPLERITLDHSRGRGDSSLGLDQVVRSLQQAQVKCLLLDEDALAESRLVVLDAEPWVAEAGDELQGANKVGEYPAPAALLRAAMLTEARTMFVPAAKLPEDTAVAGLLRWHTVSAAASTGSFATA